MSFLIKLIIRLILRNSIKIYLGLQLCLDLRPRQNQTRQNPPQLNRRRPQNQYYSAFW